MSEPLFSCGDASVGVILRRADSGDVQALSALEQAVFTGDRMSKRQFLHHTRAASSDLLVAVGSGGVLGYALMLRRRGLRIGRVYSIAVATTARGQGLAIRLLQQLEWIAQDRGLGEIRLEVRKDNAAAISVYESQGYQCFGAYTDYYEDGADAWRLRKRLPGPEAVRPQVEPLPA